MFHNRILSIMPHKFPLPKFYQPHKKIFTTMKNCILHLFLSAMLLVPTAGFSQAQRSRDFKDKYKLKEAVVLSRHNIRSPLSDSKSALGRITPHEWNKWTAAKSELTNRGGVLETG